MLKTSMIVVMLLVVLCVPVFAQKADIGSGISLSVGVYCPTDGNVKDSVGARLLDVQLGYTVSKNATSSQIVEIGLISGSKTITTPTVESNKNEFRMIPITYTYKVTPKTGTFYWGGGAGVYLGHSKNTYTDLTVTTPVADVQTESKTKFGLHVLAGVDVSKNISVDLRYTKVLGKSNFDQLSLGLDGISLSLTGRF